MSRLAVGCVNRGDHLNRAEIAEAIDDLDIVALSEMHSEKQTREWFRESKTWGIFEGRREDSEASPVVWKHETIRVLHRQTIPLLVADKRGGKYNMAKSLNVVLARHRPSDKEFWYGSVHQIQTVYTKERSPAAKLHNHKINEWGEELDRAVLLMGDWNAIWTHFVMAELRRSGWKSDAAGKKMPTFGGREIDYAVYRNLNKLGEITDRSVNPIKGTDHKRKKLVLNV